MRNSLIDWHPESEEDERMTNYFDKVTLLGPAPYGGTYTATTGDPAIARLIQSGYRIVRQWTVAVRSDGKRISIPLN